MAILYILIALLIGLGIPLQTTVNSRLREYITYPLLASLVAFGVGAVFLLSVSLATGDNILVSTAVIGSQPWWIWLGGTLGVFGLTANILIFPHIGSVQTVIIPMLGQIVMGVLIDSFGWLGSPYLPFSLWKGTGLLLVTVGIFMVVMLYDKTAVKVSNKEQRNENKWIWQTIGLGAGMLVAARSAINGRLGVVLDSSVQSGLISLISGTVVLLLITFLLRQKISNIAQAVRQKAPWWVWTGGVLGALFIVATAYLVPRLGTGPVIIIGILGQLSCSLIIDKYGLLGSRKRPVSYVQAAGLFILLAGVIIMRIA